MFSWEICKIFRKTYFEEICERLLLSMISQAGKISKIFNNFVTSAVSNLNIPWYVVSSFKTNHIQGDIWAMQKPFY